MEYRLMNVYFRGNVCKLLSIMLYSIPFYPVLCLTQFCRRRLKPGKAATCFVCFSSCAFLCEFLPREMIPRYCVCIQYMKPENRCCE